MKIRLVVAALSISLAAGAPVLAHHYFAAKFDAAKALQLKGVLTRIEWTNPHVHFYLDVKDDKGRVANWACESGSPSTLLRHGLTRDDLKFGSTVTVDGLGAIDGSRFVLVRRVTLPDGRTESGTQSIPLP